MKKILLRAIMTITGMAILLALAYPFSIGFSQTPGEVLLYEEDFEGGATPEWELEPGWQVLQEGDHHVLTGEGHAWARSPFNSSGDFRVRFRVKLVSGTLVAADADTSAEVTALTDISNSYVTSSVSGSTRPAA